MLRRLRRLLNGGRLSRCRNHQRSQIEKFGDSAYGHGLTASLARSRTCISCVSLDAQRTDAFGRRGLDFGIGFRECRALARLATERPTSDSQRTSWNEMPAFPKAVAPKRDRRLRECGHDGVGTCVTLPFTSPGARAGSLKNPCNSSSGNGNTIVLFFSAAISVNVCRYRSCRVAG